LEHSLHLRMRVDYSEGYKTAILEQKLYYFVARRCLKKVVVFSLCFHEKKALPQYWILEFPAIIPGNAAKAPFYSRLIGRCTRNLRMPIKNAKKLSKRIKETIEPNGLRSKQAPKWASNWAYTLTGKNVEIPEATQSAWYSSFQWFGRFYSKKRNETNFSFKNPWK